MSSPADCLVSALLNDGPAFRRLVGENQRRLADSAAFMRKWFEDRGMKPQQSNAGHFMLVDVRERLGIKTFEDEKEIALKSVPCGVLVVSTLSGGAVKGSGASGRARGTKVKAGASDPAADTDWEVESPKLAAPCEMAMLRDCVRSLIRSPAILGS